MVPPGPVKLLDDTDVVHVRASPARESLTSTAPKDTENDVPDAADCAPAFTSDGTVMDNAPAWAPTVVLVVLETAVVLVVLLDVEVVVVVVVGAVVVVVGRMVGIVWPTAGAVEPSRAVIAAMSTRARRGTSPLSVIRVDLARSTVKVGPH
jgi:hypothetical protein